MRWEVAVVAVVEVGAVAARHLQFHQKGLLLRELALRVAQLGVPRRELPPQLRQLLVARRE